MNTEADYPSIVVASASSSSSPDYGSISIKDVDEYENVIISTEENDHDRIDDEEDAATFFGLLKANRQFRLYMMSYIITHTGEWLTYIASIALIEKLLANSGRSSRTAISILVVVRLLPNVLLCPVGGILADGWDRRVSMIILDLFGALSSLLFLAAMYFESIELIYFVTFVQQCIAGLYEPCRSSIVPLLVPQEDHLKKAITVAGIAWSAVAAFGSSLGGLLLTWFGFRTCFVVDACSYLVSAFMMYLVKGKWHVMPSEQEEQFDSIWGLFCDMTIDGMNYLRGSFFGGLVLLKATNGVMYGAMDVLNVSFSEPNGVDENSAARLGLLFAFMGLGCTVGPLIADSFTNMKSPISLQKACVTGVAISTFGFFAIALFTPFWSICAFTLIRTGGGSTNWIDSSILLQKFASDDMMGRVLAVDYSFALLTKAFSAFLAGYMLDTLDMTPHQVAFAISCLGSLLVFCWIAYHLGGRGACAAPRCRHGKTDLSSTASQDVERTTLV